ncbi:hypothetical protein [Tessaracoccus flavescens]|uniref:hypothetical protein n=1 Tax=Tessaracoccus flavescens TaxID=399497 RepID=UPI001374843A|nr:hypothetical protein [Tessaracoccus flavescens]
MTTAPTATRAPAEWAEAFTEANNTDPEIQAHGKYFTTTWLLDAGEPSTESTPPNRSG